MQKNNIFFSQFFSSTNIYKVFCDCLLMMKRKGYNNFTWKAINCLETYYTGFRSVQESLVYLQRGDSF